MTHNELLIATVLFKNRVFGAEGQAYEDLFSSVMCQAIPNFRQVKPQGRLGDKKNDGFDPTTGSYYQVYAPEDLTTTEDKGVQKLKTDFQGLISYWSSIGMSVKSFRFVVNDKYKGVGPNFYANLNELKKLAPTVDMDIMTASQLERIFQGLEDMQILNVIGAIPSVDVTMLEMDALHCVVNHIMNSVPENPTCTIPENPNFFLKVEYNRLSDYVKSRMLAGLISENVIEEYFANNNNFMKDELRDRFNSYYLLSKSELSSEDPDGIFWDIYSKARPDGANKAVADAVITLMAYYFQCCDIFESPEK